MLSMFLGPNRLGVGCVLIVCLGLFGGLPTALRRLRWFRHLVLIERSVDSRQWLIVLVFNMKSIHQ